MHAHKAKRDELRQEAEDNQDGTVDVTWLHTEPFPVYGQFGVLHEQFGRPEKCRTVSETSNFIRPENRTSLVQKEQETGVTLFLASFLFPGDIRRVTGGK